MASRFTTHKATSLANYITTTERIHQSWDSNDELPDPWFRGLSSVSHSLQPGWYRLDDRADGIDEDDLVDEFQRRALPLVDGLQPASMWEWYFLMQHYGLPTRLLDWSECSLVGLFFAIGDWRGRGGPIVDDAVVWMLDPWYLTQWSSKKDEVPRYDDKLVARYLPERPWDEDRSPRKPIPVMPMYNSRRLTAQRGVFTMHGTDYRPLEAMLPVSAHPRFAQIVIPKRRIETMRESLRVAGITDVNLFPEMSYLSQDILRAWGLLGAPIRKSD